MRDGPTILDPQGSASRAQVAMILMDYGEHVVNAQILCAGGGSRPRFFAFAAVFWLQSGLRHDTVKMPCYNCFYTREAADFTR